MSAASTICVGHIIGVVNKGDMDLGLLSYGEGSEPARDQLLIRGAATVFASRDEAVAALSATLARLDERGLCWHEGRTFRIPPLRRPI